MNNLLIKILSIFALAFIGINSFAQGEADNWFFGSGAGINFSLGAPVNLAGSAMNANEGCATISDAAGNLLFYTNGVNVYDAGHNIMPNSGLAGGTSSSQSSIIVPDPGSTDRYYIFTTGDQDNGPLDLSYSVVDMTLNGGLGDVEVATKNTLLQNPVSEKLTAVPHCNGTDVWIVVHTDQSAIYSSYLVTATGVNATPVQSNPGGITTSPGGSNGCMKANHAGTKLANALLYDDALEIYDFDNSTGVISNAITINTDSWPYGVEFSPSDNILYLTGGNSLTNGGLPLFSYVNQIDMTAGSNAAIAASMTNLHYHDVTNNGAYLPQTPQLGPDGKIYVAINNTQFLAVIDNPDTWGPGAGYTALGFNLGNGNICNLGLPNFYSKIFEFLDTADFEFTNTCLGDATSFSTDADADSVAWNFDDPASGSANTSTIFNPSHTFTNIGTYDVQLIIYFPCNKSDTVVQQVTIEALPTASVTSNTPVCSGNDAIFTITGTPDATVTYNIDGGPDQTIVLDASGNGTVTEAGVTANTTINLSDIANPGGTPTIITGNGLSVVGGGTPGNAIGPILAAGTALDNTNSALLNGNNLSLTLTLEHTVPAGTVITIAIARMTNAGSVDITDGTNTQNFNAGPNGNSQYITFTTGQSTNTLTFTRNGGAVRLDGVEYTLTIPSTSCSSSLTISEEVVVQNCNNCNANPGTWD
jgi:hypothetical protein